VPTLYMTLIYNYTTSSYSFIFR